MPLAYTSFSLNENIDDIEYIADDRVLDSNSDLENEKNDQAQLSTEQVSMQVNLNRSWILIFSGIKD